jgi:hypothetical protein
MATTSVSDALQAMNINKSIISTITAQRSVWMTFGKKNSHLLRAQLYKMFEDSHLTQESKFMVHFFFAMIKNHKRVMDAMENLPQTVKSETWFTQTFRFIKDKLVQYVSQEKNGKFAVVHLPTTMPGLDILCFAMATDGKDSNVEEIIKRQCFAQLDLEEELQAENKSAQMDFWENQVKKSNNTNANAFKQGFQEDFYNTSASDKYSLLNIKLQELAVPPGGYSRSDIEKWYKELFQDKDLAKNSTVE